MHIFQYNLAFRNIYNEKIRSYRKARENMEYVRTKDDVHRMSLDQISQFHPQKQVRLRMLYDSYLKNTSGSTKALRESMKDLHWLYSLTD